MSAKGQVKRSKYQIGLTNFSVRSFRESGPFILLQAPIKDRHLEIENVELNQLYFYYLTTINEQGMESGPGRSASIRR